ncbi:MULTISPECIES: ankyrin repeat domain-containing protein [unclassified Anoxybacillus]|uniref:ankyrin repeat domain-containing protein n=1 Tax=unclassified Anoxybacillus TaxID=2639704 RepID=UPI0005CCC85E|nr:MULTISPECIES: ankyrin repeat domain-containing protein [unclassified Anoxybacillus]
MKKLWIIMLIALLLGGCFPSKEEKRQQLIQAIQKGDIQAVRQYIAEEKDVNFKTKNGSPLDIAMQQNKKQVALELLQAGAKSAYMPLPPLSFVIVAASSQGAEQNGELVEKMANQRTAKERDRDGNTPLHYAAGSGELEWVRLLYQQGADVNAANQSGTTPLMVAAQSGQTEIVQFLHKHGADIDHADKEGETALFQAVAGNYLETVRYLLKARADVNAQTKIGKTALMIAAEYGYEPLVSLLLEHGADVRVKDQTGNTALSLATYWHHEKIIQQLKRKGAQ